MNRYRWMLLLIAPGPIVAGSIALSRLAKSERPAPPARNEVLVRGQDPGEHQPLSLANSTPADEHLISACQARSEALLAALGSDCQAITAAPFVIAGDLSAEELQTWHKETIEPAALAMARTYFDKQPTEPVTVLLFGSKESYERYTEQLYRDRGISIYGYYKPRERTLVMNISTGGGTLVHELTHALLAFDCPDVPDWFNEGLASLHEQCHFRQGEKGVWIEGLVNWRIHRLQTEAQAGRLVPLETFIRDNDFRGEREAINYAQARYFCMFLQQQQVLEPFYAVLKRNIDNDRFGEAALRSVFPDHTWQEINAEFAEFVRQLPPPPP